jgi:hypothetical protein
MENLLVISMVWLLAVGFGLGLYMSTYIGPYKTIKRENEQLNAELHKLTDRDERGRFRGGK